MHDVTIFSRSLNIHSCVNDILSLFTLSFFLERPGYSVSDWPIEDLFAIIEVVERLEVIVRLTGS